MLNKIAQRYEIFKKLKFVGLLLYASILTFQPTFLPITLTLAFFWLFYLLSFKPARLKRLVHNIWFWWFLSFILFHALGIGYSSYPQVGGRVLLLKITLFLWPLAFASLSRLQAKHVNIILISYVVFMLLSTLTGLALSFVEYLQTGELAVFVHQNLAHWVFIPNHYFAMYVSLVILILVHNLLTITEKRYKILKIAALLYFIIFLVLLAVRIQFIALPLSLLALFLIVNIKTSTKVKSLKVFAFAVVVFIGIILLVPESRRRVTETLDELRSVNQVVNNKQTNHRVFIWGEGIEVIKENFWTGTGTGEEDYALNEKLDKIDAKFWDGKRVYYLNSKLYNYHNQFLQWFAANGILGFAFILGTFIVGIVWSVKTKSALALAFLILTFTSFFTESMLERQAGVLFFSFFFGLLVINQRVAKNSYSSQ